MKDMHRLTTLLLLAAVPATVLAAASGPTNRMYKCTDAAGKTYYTQTPPPQCLDRTTQELSKSGRVIKENEVLSDTQRQARAAEERKKAEQERAAAEERRKNMALLNTYQSEKDIDEARSRALRNAQEVIAAAQKRMAEGEKLRAKYEREKEFYVKKPLPPELQVAIQKNETDMKAQQTLIDAKQKEIAQINVRYDEDRRRYVELTRGGRK